MIIDNISQSGKVGKDGLTPFVGANGNWFLGTEDTGVRANGQTVTHITEVTLLASDWTADTLNQTVSCEGVLADSSKQIITIIPASEIKAQYDSHAIECVASAENSLTFTAETIPSEDMLIHIALEEVGEAEGASSNVYSTEETVVGTWINGKPVYRKVIYFNCPVSSTVVIAENIDTLCSQSGFISSSNGSIEYHLPYEDSTNEAYAYRDTQTSNVHFKTKNWTKSVPVVIIIEYTKTTDTATIEIPTAAALMESYEQGVNEA